MSRLQELPSDLSAVLSLLLRQRKDYAQLAAMLGIDEQAVHDRAHSALALLAPREARELNAAQREQVGEYLLGQTTPAQSIEARAYLDSSPHASAWAQALTAELAPLASDHPAAGPPPEPPARAAPASTQPQTTPNAAPPSAQPQTTPNAMLAPDQPQTGATSTPPSSRRGGAIVLGGLAAIVIVVVALIVGLNHNSGSSSPTTASNAATTGASTTANPTTSGSTTTGSVTNGSATTGSTGTGTKTGAGKSSAKPHLDSTIPLTSPTPTSKAIGVIEVASQGSMYAFLVAAEHLPPTSGFRYAAWLYNSPSDAFLLGRGPTVGSTGILKAAGALPTNASHFSKIILTEERSEKPTKPGPIVLSGAFSLSNASG
jgi:hypothetical protein